MQEVAGPIAHGDWDYANLRGDTGPLVYPAGCVYACVVCVCVSGDKLRSGVSVCVCVRVGGQACVYMCGSECMFNDRSVIEGACV